MQDIQVTVIQIVGRMSTFAHLIHVKGRMLNSLLSEDYYRPTTASKTPSYLIYFTPIQFEELKLH